MCNATKITYESTYRKTNVLKYGMCNILDQSKYPFFIDERERNLFSMLQAYVGNIISVTT